MRADHCVIELVTGVVYSSKHQEDAASHQGDDHFVWVGVVTSMVLALPSGGAHFLSLVGEIDQFWKGKPETEKETVRCQPAS